MVLSATLFVWAVYAVLKTVDVAVSALVTHNNNVFLAIYTRLQPYSTYASLALYAVSLAWVLMSRAMGVGERFSLELSLNVSTNLPASL